MCALGQFFKYNVYHTLQSLLKNEKKKKKNNDTHTNRFEH